MILSISGVPGSGKTSAGKLVARKLGFAFHSTGGLFRKMAEERGLTINELMKLGEEDITIHERIDDAQRRLGIEQDRFVIEGRLSWHFIPTRSNSSSLRYTRSSAPYLRSQTGLRCDRRVEADYQSIEETEGDY